MKILWTVNTINPEIGKKMNVKSSHFISWVEAMGDRISKNNNIDLVIAAPGKVKKTVNQKVDGIEYFIVPENNNKEDWNRIIKSVKPDIIHGYGTEKKHNLVILEEHPNIPMIISLQGILSEYQHHYYAGIDYLTMLRYTSIRDIIRPSGFFSGRKKFINDSKNEKKILKKAKFVEGRSTWDRVSALNINKNLKYYYCPRMLRKEFYNSTKWDIKNIKRHTLLISQGNYPIKGVHFAFMAIAKLKEKYPNIKIIITGSNIFKQMNGLRYFLKPGYQRYLYRLANKLNIMSNIEFVGQKSAKEMCELLLKTHIAVISSSIENAPNSLAESMLLGVPTIASFVGGNMDMMEHKKEGFLYCYNEPNMLAEYIDNIFESDDLANLFSKNAQKKVEKTNDPKALVNKLILIYEDVLKNK